MGCSSESGCYTFTQGWRAKEEREELRGRLGSRHQGSAPLAPLGVMPTGMQQEPNLNTENQKARRSCPRRPVASWEQDGWPWTILWGLVSIPTQQTTTFRINI